MQIKPSPQSGSKNIKGTADGLINGLKQKNDKYFTIQVKKQQEIKKVTNKKVPNNVG
jgi:hypothetical protein